ncbi:molybdopterin molybdotransferase MoeA [Bermanella sp. WJH001]|uniref:molybdopterin molybdotransferase MoeA n=1 Tax=Bermanella sp. WJH001 TaxID=3048005 RepID=UPI0024BDA274|nr:molybdopterin molybdotransferase MoeA [Bermanella sp. WJH001]MDJ1537979.1 molybdopterin molybdotransferase MoeA [Bermanella sp. WJH001]
MTDCCSAPGLTPFEVALEQLLSQVNVTQKTQLIPLEQACGRVLAQDIISEMQIPSADNSAMDGYAIRSADLINTNTLKQIGKVFAGHPLDQVIEAGQCVRIMTGGQIPAGCDAVVMQENTQSENDDIIFLKSATVGDNIRRAGEDISIGQTLLTIGRRLSPSDIGLLASLGVARVNVFEKLNVAVISTGDELQVPANPLKPGQFYESNGYTVSALLERFGVNVINFGIVPDNMAQLKETFIQADAQADIVITSGGVSVGEADYTKSVIEELGRIDFWKLAIKPGKPFAFGHLSNSYVIGLPGNPVSALVTLHQLAVPMMRKISGQKVKAPLRLNAINAKKLHKRPGRMDFQRGYFSVNENGNLEVQATGAQGSGILTSMSQANCYIVLPQDSGNVDSGETVMIEPFDALLE